MYFDWITWGIWLIGLIILVIWIYVPIKEFKKLYGRMAERLKALAWSASVSFIAAPRVQIPVLPQILDKISVIVYSS